MVDYLFNDEDNNEGLNNNLSQTIDPQEELEEGIRRRDKYNCQLCYLPQGRKKLLIHNINGNKKNIHPDNLITLCSCCQRKLNTWLRINRRE